MAGQRWISQIFSKSNTGQMVSALRIQAPGGFKKRQNGPQNRLKTCEICGSVFSGISAADKRATKMLKNSLN
jgi:hypothetical protein